MDIQEFSRQLVREEHPSPLIHVLQLLRGVDAAQISGDGWAEWPEVEACEADELFAFQGVR